MTSPVPCDLPRSVGARREDDAQVALSLARILTFLPVPAVVSSERAAFDHLLVGSCEHAHALQVADDVPRVIARERPRVKPVLSIAADKPGRLLLVAPSVRGGREAEQEGLVLSPAVGQPDLLHDGGERGSDGPVRFVEDGQREVLQKLVLSRIVRQPSAERLDSGDDDMSVTRGRRSGLSAPHPGYAKLPCLGAKASPHLCPGLDSLLAEFVAVRDPENTTLDSVVTHGLDNRLNSNAGLSRAGRHG